MPGMPKRRATISDLKRLESEPQEWEEALDKIAGGQTLLSYCVDNYWRYGEVRRWIAEDAGREAAYQSAVEYAADMRVEESLGIVDDLSEEPASRKVRVGFRQWYAGKLNRRKYGEQVQVQVTHVDVKLAIEEARGRLIDVTPEKE